MDIDFDDADGDIIQPGSLQAAAAATAAAGPSSSSTRTAALHRIRFVDYSPSPITSIALTPSTYNPAVHYPYLPSIDSPQGREILAVGRQNGDIEIYTWIGGMGGQKLHSASKGKKRTEQGNRQGWVLERVRLAFLDGRQMNRLTDFFLDDMRDRPTETGIAASFTRRAPPLHPSGHPLRLGQGPL